MIDIIIPYYNSSDTISRTLHSIAMQTAYRKVIVTIVDDCSDELIEGWDNKNQKPIKKTTFNFLRENIFPMFNTLNIRYLLNTANGGPGAARNIGIVNSFSDWIMFLDSDDCLANPTAIEVINNEIQRNRPDIFITRFQQQTNKELISMPLLNKTWTHGKVFKTSFLKENEIFFPEIRGNEDSSFCSIVFAYAKNILQLDFTSYTWLNNRKSMVRSDKDYYGNYLPDFVKGREFAYNKIKQLEDKEKEIDEVLSTLLTIYWQYLDLYNYRKDIVNDYLEEVKNYLRLINFNGYFSNEDFMRRLSIRYWERKHKPHYGPLLPHIGLVDFYNSVYSGVWLV